MTAYSLYDFADSGFATTIVTVLYSQYYAGTVAGGAQGVTALGMAIPGATLFAWMISLSMAVVTVSAPFLGVLADRRGSRIRSLVLFWLPGVGLTISLATVGPGDWVRGGLLFVAAYACFAASSVFYNAILPEVGPSERLGRISGFAWGVGYLGGALLLVLNLLMLQRPQFLGFAPGAFSIRDCFASAGWWWFAFALPLVWVFRYEDRARHGLRPPTLGIRVEARETVAQVLRTLAVLVRVPNLRRFFVAYLLYNDGVQTVVAMASIFGSQELGMPPDQLILFFLLIQFTAFGGSIVLGWMADRVGHKQVLLISVSAWLIFTAWGAMVGIFGDPVGEYWILGGLAGLFLGGIQACSRSMIAHWIPPGKESELFAFFAIMTRVASIFGPAIYGGLVVATGSLRRATLSVSIFFLLGGALLLRVKPEAIGAERRALADGGSPGSPTSPAGEPFHGGDGRDGIAPPPGGAKDREEST